MDLKKIKEFAEENWCKPDSESITVDSDFIAVSNPWIDSSARFPLTDEEAVHEWGLQLILDFCEKADAAMRKEQEKQQIRNPKFIVKYVDDESSYLMIQTDEEIFSKMDMADASNTRIDAIRLYEPDRFLEICRFYGVWHNLDDPRRMEIRDEDGNVISAGYGTDH